MDGNGDAGADRAAVLFRRWRDEGDTESLDELLGLEIAVLKDRLRGRAGRASERLHGTSDIAQEAVVRFLQVDPPPRFDALPALRAYLWTAAWRLLVKHLESAERRAVRLDDLDSWNGPRGISTSGGIGAVEARDGGVALELALNLLEPSQREILRLVYLQHLGIDGAAEALGVARETANTRLVRARRELAKKLCRWEERIDAP